MKIVFSKNSSILSKLIRWVFDEPVSHMAIVFNEDSGCGVVFQSNLLGCHIMWLKSFYKKNNILIQKSYGLPLELENSVWSDLVNKLDGKPYDYKGALYLLWRGLLHKFFRLPIPETNPWNDSGAYFCDELYEALPDIFDEVEGGVSMRTPFMLSQKLTEGRCLHQQT